MIFLGVLGAAVASVGKTDNMPAALSWRFGNEPHQEIQILSEKKLLQWLKVMYIFPEVGRKCKFHIAILNDS